MAQTSAQTVPRHAGWLLVGPPAATSLVPQVDITVTFPDGSSVVIPAGTPATLPDSTTTWDRTKEVVIGYVIQGSGTLLATPESGLATVTGAYAPLVRVLADSVQVYQPESYLAAGGLGAATGSPSTSTMLTSGTAAKAHSLAGVVTTLTSSTAAKALSLWNGSSNNSPPANWETSGFDDSAWSTAVVATIVPTSPSSTGVSGTSLIWAESTPAANTEVVLFRHVISVPAGTALGGNIQLGWDDFIDEVYLNGVALPAGTAPTGVPTTQDNDWGGATNVVIPASAVVPGATNVLAIKVRNNAPNNAWISYRLHVATTTASPPTNWQQPSFDDSAWTAAAVATITPTTPSSTGVSGTQLIWPEATPSSDAEQGLFRQHFSVPAGLIASAVLHLGWDDFIDAVYVNGTALPGVPTTLAEDWSGSTALSVPLGDLIAGADNVLAIEGHNVAPSNAWVSYALSVTMGGARGADSAHEGDLLYYHNGQWIDLPLGSSGQVLTVTGGDPAWAAPTGSYTDPLTTKGDLVARTGSATTREPVGSDGQVLTADSTQSTGIKWSAVSSGGVTSVAFSAPATFTVSGSPITSSGTITLAWATQSAGTVLAGPASGAAAAPTFRALVPADVGLSHEGGLLYQHSAALSELPVGAPGTVLLSNGTDPVWGDDPALAFHWEPLTDPSVPALIFDALGDVIMVPRTP